MKRVLSACAVAALTLVPAPALAQSVNMAALLTGGGEVPKVSTGAFGTASVLVDVTASELTIRLSLFNLPTSTTVGHIHIGSLDVAGPTMIDFPASAVAGRSGDFSVEFRVGASAFTARAAQGVLTISDAIQTILAGQAYINIHTSANPGGEIRGQLFQR